MVSAAAAAERGFPVICFDPDKERIKALEQGRLSIAEPNLASILARNRERLRFSFDSAELSGCSIVYISEDVPTDERGLSVLEPIVTLIEMVTRSLSLRSILVILSQVAPGFTRALDTVPLSRRFYQVETLVFGRAVERALHPERFIIGGSDPVAPLPSDLDEFLRAFNCPVLFMNYESAELAKISINLMLSASIGMANTLADICERVGANWHDIVPALRLDARIGPHAYINPGLGISGGNLDRDLVTARNLADQCGADDSIVRACQANSRIRRNWVLTQFHKRVVTQYGAPTLGVLGLAYKADTSSIKNSPAIGLLTALPNVRMRCYDPVVQMRQEYHSKAIVVDSALAVCDGADAIAIMTPWPEFRTLSPKAMAKAMTGRVVIDPYGMLDEIECQMAGLVHIRLGTASPRSREAAC